MKPILLKMCAFGPYAKETVVDFEKLGNSGIFLLTGDTGAGKTTVFDALCYALYGEASGQERDAKSFRSDYAAQKDDTYVEFTFEHNRHKYRIRRNPEYERPKKSGTGTTKQIADAVLEDMDTQQVWTGIGIVKEKVEQLIGLTRNQFTQTVMIAQGDFRKILTAASKDRIDLFRKLFNTELYEQVEKKLGDMNRQCEQEKEGLNGQIDREMEAIQLDPDFSEREVLLAYRKSGDAAHVIEVLARLVEHESGLLRELERNKKENNARSSELIKTITQAKNDNQAFEELRALQEKLDRLVCRRNEIDDAARQVERARRASNINSAENALAVNQNTIDKWCKTMREASDALQKTGAALPDARAKADAAQAALPKADEMQAQAKQLESAVSIAEALEKNRKEYQKAKKQLDRLLADVQVKEEAYQRARNAFFSNQYGLIAQKLQPGEPCPVCGSTAHPAPAVLAGETATQEEMENAEAALSAAKDRLHDANAQAREIKSAIETDQKRLEDAGIVGTAQEIRAQAKRLTEEAEKLRAADREAQEKLSKLEKAFERDNTSYNTAQENVAETKAKHVELTSEFSRLLAENGFEDRADYDAAKRSLKDVERMDADIRKYGEERKSCEDMIESLQQKLAGKQLTDVAALETEQKALDGLLTEIEKDAKERNGRLQMNERTLKRLRDCCAKKEKKRDHWAIVSETYKVVAGQHIAPGQKSGKLHLETYVQQYYFKQVVYAANQRLRSMTDGMFTLRCKEEAANLRSQAGLDLDVFDRSTGRWRDVKTLSGGESFMASLALALGLSDVVQAGSGGIRMDSMFIDEGFGSLDENALNRALEMLASLADGKRLIGVISHVHELRERIDRKIVVRKEQNGSTIEISC